MYSNGGSQDNRGGFSLTQPLLSPNAFAIAMVCMNVCFGVAGLAGAYLLLGLFTGHLTDFATLTSAADKTRILSNLSIASQVMLWAGALGAVCGGVAFLTEEAAGYIMLFGAALIGFGIPMGFAQLGGGNFTPEKNEALRVSLGAFPAAALFPGIVAALMITRDVILRLIRTFQPKERFISEEEMRFGSGVAKQAPTPAHKPSPLPGKCWEGSYCRETIKVHCPVFHSKTPCWKQKRGCYCEESIVAEAASKINGVQLPMAGNAAAAGSATGRFNFSSKSTARVGGDVPRVSRTLTDGEKRARCRSCVIYNEHQQKKYSLLMPITIGATIFVWAMLLTTLRVQVDHAFVATLGVLDRVSFTPDSGALHQARLSATEASPYFMWPMVVGLGIMILSKTLQALEWALFKLKI